MTKNFDPTKPVQTRDGRKARILCVDRKSEYYPILALYEYDGDGEEQYTAYTKDGRVYDSEESDRDLINIPPEVVDVFYCNVYNNQIGDTKFEDEHAARYYAGPLRSHLGVIKVTIYADKTFDIEKV